MKKTTRFYPRIAVDTAAVGAVGQAGGVLLTGTAEANTQSSRRGIGGFWRSVQQQVADQFDRLLER